MLRGLAGNLHKYPDGAPWFMAWMGENQAVGDMGPITPQQGLQAPLVHTPISPAGDEGQDGLTAKEFFPVMVNKIKDGSAGVV